MAGNEGKATATSTIATVTLHPIVGHGSRPTFAGVCSVATGEDTSAKVIVSPGHTTTGTPVQTMYVGCAPGTGAFSAPVQSALADGTYTAEAIQSDIAGDTATSTQTFTVGTAGQKPAVRMIGTPRVGITGKRLPAKARVPLKLRCVEAPCSGWVKLTVVETGSGRIGKADGHSGKRTHRRVTLTYGRASYRMAAGKMIRVTLTLTRAGRSAMAAAERNGLRLTETVTVRGGATVGRTIVVRLLAP